MTLKFYFKKMIWGVIPIIIFYFGWRENPESVKAFNWFVFSVVSGILYPFAHIAAINVGLKITKKEFWEKDFFTSATGGSLQAILFIFCFVFAIPIVIVSAIFILIKRLIGKS